MPYVSLAQWGRHPGPRRGLFHPTIRKAPKESIYAQTHRRPGRSHPGLCAIAGDMATPDEAKTLSQKAQSAVNAMGAEKAYVVFADPAGGFQAKDLYVFCMDMEKGA